MDKQPELLKTQIRLPQDLYDAIKDLATDSGRSMNGEMVELLRTAIGEKEPPVTLSQLKSVLQQYNYNSATKEIKTSTLYKQRAGEIISNLLSEQEKRMYEIAREVKKEL